MLLMGPRIYTACCLGFGGVGCVAGVEPKARALLPVCNQLGAGGTEVGKLIKCGGIFWRSG